MLNKKNSLNQNKEKITNNINSKKKKKMIEKTQNNEAPKKMRK